MAAPDVGPTHMREMSETLHMPSSINVISQCGSHVHVTRVFSG